MNHLHRKLAHEDVQQRQEKAMQDSQTCDEIVRMISQLAEGRIQPLKAARRTAVQWALAQSEGNISHAAQMLGISRGTIYRYAK